MEISRIGAAANHGSRSVRINELQFAWQIGSATMQAKSAKSVGDFATESRHRYTIRMSLEEVGLLLESLAKDCAEIEDEVLRTVLRPRVADLLKIATRASTP